MGTFRIRPATQADAPALLRVRHDAILGISFAGATQDQLRRWAERRDIDWMVHAMRGRQTWAATVDGEIVSWIAIKNDGLEGLYTDPRHSGCGIGSSLLQFVEGVLKDRGIERILVDASINAESFYRRHGYKTVGPGSSEAARTMQKAITQSGWDT